MSRHPPLAEGSDASAAMQVVEAEVLRICVWAGICPPTVKLVTGLGRGGVRGNTTAEISSIKTGGQAELNMPIRIVKECSQPGWYWLVAHEVGHIAVRSPRSDILRWTLTAASIGLLLAGLVVVIVSAVSEYNGSEGRGGGVLVAVLICVSVGLLSTACALRRKEESNADRFAVAYSGDIQGAEEYFKFTGAQQRQPTPSHLFAAPVLWLFRSHPSPHERMSIMRRELGN